MKERFILQVFLPRLLLDHGFDSAVAERAVYPGFLLPKVLELEWVVLIVDRNIVLAAS